MSHRLRLVCLIAVSFFASAALLQTQSTSAAGRASARDLALISSRSGTAVSAFPGQASSTTYTFASSPKPQDNSQQQSNGNQGQSQNGNQNQNQSMSGNQNQNQNQNSQGQAKDKEEAPPPKPSYLTYTVKKKSLEEQAKTGKALSVDFKSVPAGASITVDGYFVGHTPTTAHIPVGKHLVSITKWGYDTWTKEMEFASGKTLSVNPTLHRNW